MEIFNREHGGNIIKLLIHVDNYVVSFSAGFVREFVNSGDSFSCTARSIMILYVSPFVG